MGLLNKNPRSVVGLDIEPGFMAAAEFSNNSKPTLQRAATSALTPGMFTEGEVTNVDGLAEQLRAFFRDNDLPKVVRLGVASQKIVVRVIELPDIEGKEELDAAVRFQAQEELPMPLEQAVLDHRVLGKFHDGESTRMRVLIVAARRETIEHLLAAARKAGLDPQMIDLSAFAIVRALYVPSATPGTSNGANAEDVIQAPHEIAAPEPAVPIQTDIDTTLNDSAHDIPDLTDVSGDATEMVPPIEIEPGLEAPAELPTITPQESVPDPPAVSFEVEPVGEPATLYCHVGGLTNLAIANGTECVFNRVLQNGIESMAATLAERKGLTLEHARQWINHVALEKDVETIEGEKEIIAEAREVLSRGVSKIADEIRLSLEYYQGSVPNAHSVERVVLAGQAIALAGFPAVLEREVGLTVEPRSLGAFEVKPGALDNVDGAQLTVAAGLAIDEVTT